jgi:AraC-like DNA-binding protein
MPSEPTDFATLRVSTDALPARERVPFWREVFAHHVVRLDVEPLPDVPFKATAALRALSGLSTLSSSSSAARLQRTPQIVADGDDSVALVVKLNGSMTTSQHGRDVSLGHGDATLIVHADPGGAMIYADTCYEALTVPHAALAPLAKHLEDAAMRLIPHGNEALRLLMTYLATVRDDLVLATPELRRLIATHVHDLLAMTIGATRDGAALAEHRGVRAARLAAIKRDVMEHLVRRDLTLVAVAARQRVTPRYVQMLFESEGTTFSEFVLGQRLARAHRMLADPRHAGSTIITVAFAAGFGDISYFNRAFRSRYGATPSDVRAEAQRAGADSPMNANINANMNGSKNGK